MRIWLSLSAVTVLLAVTVGLLAFVYVPGERLTWLSGDIELVGTLVLPASQGPHPLIIYIAGSGCVDRDMRSNQRHAAKLAEMGVASFRYDKRGCGDSGGDRREVGFEQLETICSRSSTDL